MLTDPLFSDAEIEAMAVRATPAQEHLRAAVVGALRDMRLRYEADRLALVAALQEEIGHADARVESARETVATVLRSSEIQVYAVRLPAGTWLGHDKYGATEEQIKETVALSGFFRHWGVFMTGLRMDRAKFEQDARGMAEAMRRPMAA